MNNIKKDKIILFAIIIASVAIIFIILSYKTILENSNNNKNNLNSKNLNSLIYKIESKINLTNKIAITYSADDDLFNYLQYKDNHYINKNFRKGTYTLEDLDMSYLIIENNKNEVYYSTSTKDIEKENFVKLQKYLTKYFNKIDKANTIVFFNKSYYTLSKRAVYNSTYEKKTNGFIYLGSKINKEDITNFKKGFVEFEVIENNNKLINLTTQKSNDISRIIMNQVKDHEYNNLLLFDNKSQLLFKIKTKSDFNDFDNSTRTIQLTLVTFLILFITMLSFLTYRYKKDVKQQNDLLEEIIEERTNNIEEEIDELKRTNSKLYDIAHTDFLTKSMNRRNFFIHAQNIFTDAVKENKAITIVMIDIDNFKSFNDNYGHDVGDMVLVEFAQCIKENIKEDTIFGRLGGEEFALLMSNCTLEDAMIESEFLKGKVEELDIKVGQNITASFGVSDRNTCANIDEMLQKADRLLYNAKESGRNLVRSRLNIKN